MDSPADNTETVRLAAARAPKEFSCARLLFEEYASALGFGLQFQNFDEELRHLPQEYGPPSGLLLLAYVGDLAVGCVGLRRFQGTICEMKRLYVRPAYRHRRIGRLLAERVVGEARRLGYATMRLDTIATMERARELYASMGFKEIPPYRFNPVSGAVFMELALTGSAEWIAWQWRSFANLGTDDLYDILALRQMVFIVEQHCAYLDADGLDRSARHLLGRKPDGTLAASLRLLPPGCRFDEPSLGRVVTDSRSRGRGLGRLLMKNGIAEAARLYPGFTLKLSAQEHLRSFYESLGFMAEGLPYDEDGIPHVAMVRPSAGDPLS